MANESRSQHIEGVAAPRIPASDKFQRQVAAVLSIDRESVRQCTHDLTNTLAHQDQRRRSVRESFSMHWADFVGECMSMLGGPDHGLRIAVFLNGLEGEEIEVTGCLPRAVLQGAKRAFAWWESPRSGWVPWDDATIVWLTTESGYGPRYAVHGLGALLDLVAERRLALEGGRA